MASTDPSEFDPEQDPASEISNDPYAGELPSEPAPAGNRPAQGARQLTAAEAAAMFPEMGIDSQMLESNAQPAAAEPAFAEPVDPVTHVSGDLDLVDPVDSAETQTYSAGEGDWPSLDEDEESEEARHAYSSPFDEDDDFASGGFGAPAATSSGGKGKWLIAGVGVAIAAAGVAIVLPRLSAPATDAPDRGSDTVNTDASDSVDGRRLIDSLPNAPQDGTTEPSTGQALPIEVASEPGPASTWVGNMFSGGDAAPLANLDEGMIDPAAGTLLPKGSTFLVPDSADSSGEGAWESSEDVAEQELATDGGSAFGFDEPYFYDPFQDDIAVQHELARLLAEISGEQPSEWGAVPELSDPNTPELAFEPLDPAAVTEVADSLDDLERELAEALARIDRAHAEMAHQRSETALAKARERSDEAPLDGWAPLDGTQPDENAEVAVSEPETPEDSAEVTPLEPAATEEVDPLDLAIAALGSEQLEETLSEETPLDSSEIGSDEQTADAAIQEPSGSEEVELAAGSTPEQAPELEAPRTIEIEAALGPSPIEAERAAALAQLADSETDPQVERRTQTLGFDDQLLLPDTPGGVGFATSEDLAHVWGSASLPEETIHSKNKLLTPAVGMVRLVCTNGEAFDGVLQSVGQSRLTLRSGLGSMTFDADDVAQIQRMNGRMPDMPHAPIKAAGEKVRVRTPGGLLVGSIISRHDGRITLMTESGGRITLADEGVEPFRSDPRTAALGFLPGPDVE